MLDHGRRFPAVAHRVERGVDPFVGRMRVSQEHGEALMTGEPLHHGGIARLLTLLYAASISYTFMDVLHVYIWPVVLLFACLGLWYYWFEEQATA